MATLHDPDARPIRKGRSGRSVDFGYNAQIADNADGLVLAHQIVVGKPPDAPTLDAAIACIKACLRRAPNAVTPHSGYAEAPINNVVSGGASKQSPFPAEAVPGRPPQRGCRPAGSCASSTGAPAAKHPSTT